MKFRVFLPFVLSAFALISFTFASETGQDLEIGFNEENDDLILNDFHYEDINEIDSKDTDCYHQVPSVQYDNAFRIFITIFCIFKFIEAKEYFYEVLAILSVMTLPVQLQLYFGYYFTYAIDYCPIVLNKIKYCHGGNFVSFNRWLLTPFSWITEILLLLPVKNYQQLQPYLPQRNVLLMIFLVQILHYIGLFDILASNCKQSNRNE